MKSGQQHPPGEARLGALQVHILAFRVGRDERHLGKGLLPPRVALDEVRRQAEPVGELLARIRPSATRPVHGDRLGQPDLPSQDGRGGRVVAGRDRAQEGEGSSPPAVGHVVGEGPQGLAEKRAVLPEGVEAAHRGRLAHAAETTTVPLEVTVVDETHRAAGGQERRPVAGQAVANSAKVFEVAWIEWVDPRPGRREQAGEGVRHPGAVGQLQCVQPIDGRCRGHERHAVPAHAGSGPEHDVALVEVGGFVLSRPGRLAEPVVRDLHEIAVQHVDLAAGGGAAGQPGQRRPVSDPRVTQAQGRGRWHRAGAR